jgi:hypothetical protein
MLKNYSFIRSFEKVKGMDATKLATGPENPICSGESHLDAKKTPGSPFRHRY